VEYIKSGDKEISRIGFGTWVIGGNDWGLQSDSDSINALREGIRLGYTHIDTAQAYGHGHAEDLIGKVICKHREKLFIASKTVCRPPHKIEQTVQLSLKRMKTDYLDLYYIHWPSSRIEHAPIMEILQKLKRQGIIRAVGVSNFSVAQMIDCMRAGSIDIHQVCYSLLWRWPERDILPYCKKYGINVVTYSTLAQGILTGKFARNTIFNMGDLRSHNVFFDPDVWPYVYDAVTAMQNVAKNVGVSLASLAAQWVLQKENVLSSLVGSRNALQARQNASLLDIKASETTLQKLTEISDSVMAQIPDTGNIFKYYP
jgi:aryl-alcohol dehydrogenase-like predicted oxidoreductase